MLKQKITTVALLVAISTANMAFAASSTTTSSVANTAKSGTVLKSTGSSSSAESCDDISQDVSKTWAEKVKAILPSSPEDNVSNAVVNSGAMETNQQSMLDGVFDFSLASMSVTGASIWSGIQALGKKVLEKAKEAAARALETAAKSAVRGAVSAVNTAYATQVAKLSSKLGYGGQVVTQALGGVIPSITTTAGSCAVNLDTNCVSKLSSAISESVDQGTSAATKEIGRIASNQINSVTGKVADKVSSLENKLPSSMSGSLSSAISGATIDVYEAGEATIKGIYSSGDSLKSSINTRDTQKSSATSTLYGN